MRSPFAPGAARQVSSDRRLAYALSSSAAQRPDSGRRDPRVVTQAQAMAGPGFAVQLGGTPVEKVEKPAFGASEGLGILAAVVILLLAFGSVIAMLLPVASAIVAVAPHLRRLDLISHALTVPSFGPELAALVGLGVGIDYALFVVTRYRSALQAGSPPEDAVVVPMATSGRAVLFAGSTVVLSLLGLFLLGLPFIYGAALAAIIAVLLVMTASMTLLPAALGFAGPASTASRSDGGRAPGGAGASVDGGAGWSSAGRGWPAAPRSAPAGRWPPRSSRCAWRSATPAPARPHTPAARPTTCSRPASARVATARWSSRCRSPAAAGQAGAGALRTPGGQPDVAFVSPPRSTRPGTPPSSP